MNLVLFNYVCANCGHDFQAPDTAGGYGEFVLRSEISDVPAYVAAFEDSVFGEVSELLRSIQAYRGLDDSTAADLFQRVFGAACDPAPDGTTWDLTRFPACPACGSREMRSWDAAGCRYNGPELAISHDGWNALDRAGKEDLLRAAVKAATRDIRIENILIFAPDEVRTFLEWVQPKGMQLVIAERARASRHGTLRFDDPDGGLSLLISSQGPWSVEVGRVEWADQLDTPAWFDALAWATCLDTPLPASDLPTQLAFFKTHWSAIAAAPSSFHLRLERARRDLAARTPRRPT